MALKGAPAIARLLQPRWWRGLAGRWTKASQRRGGPVLRGGGGRGSPERLHVGDACGRRGTTSGRLKEQRRAPARRPWSGGVLKLRSWRRWCGQRRMEAGCPRGCTEWGGQWMTSAHLRCRDSLLSPTSSWPGLTLEGLRRWLREEGCPVQLLPCTVRHLVGDGGIG
jgi:hypothetical protein